MTKIRIGLVEAARLGSAHSAAFQNAVLTFGPEPALPVLEVICSDRPQRSNETAEALGFRRRVARWQEVVSDPDVDVVDIATPGGDHAEIALAAIANGKHVYCDKPLALSGREARAVAQAAEKAGLVTVIGFAFLRNPMQGLARKLVSTGALGSIRSFRATFDQDALTDPGVPFNWRMDRAVAGAGALGDMGSHAIGLALMLVGPIHKVCGMSRTFVAERPVAGDGSAGVQAARPMRKVENEDVAQFLCEFANGAVGHVTASRMGTGRKLGLTYEIQGEKGALCFNQERMDELNFFQKDEPSETAGYKTLYTGPEQPGYAAFHPIAGVALGYNDQKTLEARELIEAVAEKKPALADFRFGCRVDAVVEAVARSIQRRGWVELSEVE